MASSSPGNPRTRGLLSRFATRRGPGYSASARFLQSIGVDVSESHLRDLYGRQSHGRSQQTAQATAERNRIEAGLSGIDVDHAVDPGRGFKRGAPLSGHTRFMPAHAGWNLDSVQIGRWGPNGGPLPLGARPLSPDAILSILRAAEARWPNASPYGLHIYGENVTPSGGGAGSGHKRGRSPKVAKLDIQLLQAGTLSERGRADAGIAPRATAEHSLQNFSATPSAVELGIPASAGTLDNPYGLLYDELRNDIAVVRESPILSPAQKEQRARELIDEFGGRWATRVSPYVWRRIYYVKIWQARDQTGPRTGGAR